MNIQIDYFVNIDVITPVDIYLFYLRTKKLIAYDSAKFIITIMLAQIYE
jgi:hypothetical protein